MKNIAKPGRNDLCPCGSGIKYKKCCMNESTKPVMRQKKKVISLAEEMETIQDAAEKGEWKIRELGVFVLFATESGDGWLLEVTGEDALQLAKEGKPLGVEVEVTPETISINWSHRFVIRDKAFETTAYLNDAAASYPDYPTASIASSVRRIRKRFSPELLEGLHVKS